MDINLKNEINKGYKTFKVFEMLQSFAEQIDGLEQQISEKKRQNDKIASDGLRLIEENDIAAKKLLEANQKAEAVIADADAKRQARIKEANDKATQINADANQQLEIVKGNIAAANSELSSIRTKIKDETAVLGELEAKISKIRKDLQSFIGDK